MPTGKRSTFPSTSSAGRFGASGICEHGRVGSDRRVFPFAVAGFGLVIGVLGEITAARGIYSTTEVVVDSVYGVTTLLAGLAVWLRRPDSRLGPLITVMGVMSFPAEFSYGRDQALVDLVGFPLQGWNDVGLVALILLFPTGRLSSRPAAWVLGGVVVSHLGLSLSRLLLRPPLDPSTCFCVPNRFLPVTDPAAYDAADRVFSIAEAGFAIAALVLVVMRWRDASGPARRTLGWLAAAGAATAAILSFNRLHTRLGAEWIHTGPTVRMVIDVVSMLIPLAVAVVLVRGRRARVRVADLVVGLSQEGSADPRAELRKALADPSVQLVRWSEQQGSYVDDHGGLVRLPDGDERAATVLDAGDTRLGALIHDPALLEERELLTSVAAAARMALHNERLADEVRLQLEQVQASRRRLVEVAEAERHRLERDLHDGAQQHLLALTMNARRAQRRAEGDGDPELARQLATLSDQATTALEQIRALAHGIRPSLLSESGLGATLRSLAHQFPLPVETDVDIPGRLDDAVEATAYFVATEALTNVLKYAEATRVHLAASTAGGELELVVADDGLGGASGEGGSGLIGLSDRLEALGGTLEVDSPPGAGTRLTARIPAEPVFSPRTSPSGR